MTWTCNSRETSDIICGQESHEFDRLGSVFLWLTVAGAFLVCFEAVRFMGWYAVRDYLLEWREFGIMYSTDLLLQGKNPYALELQPTAINPYGILYNIAVVPVAWIYGSIPVVHRAVSCTFIIMTCAYLLWAMKKTGTSLPLAFVGTAVFFGHFATSIAITARPDSMGQFFCITCLVFPMMCGFRTGPLIVSGALALLAFLAKTYFFLGAPFLALYLFLFESKLKGLYYGLGVGVAFVAMVALVNSICETYLINTVFLVLGSVTSNITHLRINLFRYTITHFGFIASFFWAYGFIVGTRPTAMQAPSFPKINLWDIRKPLVEAQISFPACMAVFALVILVAKMGWHIGQAQLYYHQILTPFLMWWIVATLDRIRIRRWWLVMAPPMVINLVLMATFLLFVEYETPLYVDRSSEWKSLEKVIENHKDVLQSSALAYLAKKHGKPLYDTGWYEYYPNVEKFSFLPQTLPYLDQCSGLQSRIMEKVRQGKFDLVMQPAEELELVPPSILKANYHIARYMSVPLPFHNNLGAARLAIWEPNRKQ